jgi:hypothetical protein
MAMLTIQSDGKTGTAPGTTTLVLGPGGTAKLADVQLGITDFDRGRMFDYLPYGKGWIVATPAAGDLGITDFDRGRMFDYLPYGKGWIVGTLGDNGEAPSQVLSTEESEKLKTHFEMRTARAQALTAERDLSVHAVVKKEEIKSQRSERIWTAVTALVGVGSLLVAVLALRQ